MSGILSFLNQNTGAIQAVSTVILVLITAWYARLTHRLAISTEGQLELARRSELMNRNEATLHVAGIAKQLFDDVVELQRRQIPELLTKMRSVDWQELRDELELSSITVGGIVQKDAAIAANSLRDWEDALRSIQRRSGDKGDLWAEANRSLEIAQDALNRLCKLAN